MLSSTTAILQAFLLSLSHQGLDLSYFLQAKKDVSGKSFGILQLPSFWAKKWKYGKCHFFTLDLEKHGKANESICPMPHKFRYWMGWQYPCSKNYFSLPWPRSLSWENLWALLIIFSHRPKIYLRHMDMHIVFFLSYWKRHQSSNSFPNS